MSRDSGGQDDGVMGRVIPRRRFTRWAAGYLLLYVCLPVLALGVLAGALVYAVFGLFG